MSNTSKPEQMGQNPFAKKPKQASSSQEQVAKEIDAGKLLRGSELARPQQQRDGVRDDPRGSDRPLLPEFGNIDTERTGSQIYGSAVKAVWSVAAETEAFKKRARELSYDPSKQQYLYETEGVPAARVERAYGYVDRRNEGADFISISGPLKGMHIDVMCVPQHCIDAGHLDPKVFSASLYAHLRDHDITIVDMRNIPKEQRDKIKEISKDGLKKYAGKYTIYE